MNRFNTFISSFDGRGTMNVTLTRPSILTLAKLGKIPNPLLAAATKLFEFAPQKEAASIKEVGEVLHIIAEAALVRPKYENIKASLTDEQLMEIYHYAKGGADELECFRRLPRVYTSGDSSKKECKGSK